MKKAILLAILGLFLCFGQASADIYTLSPTADSFVNSGTSAASNFNYLYTGGFAGSTTFLKFDVSSLVGQTITAATLYLNSQGTFSPTGSGTTAYYSADDCWTQSSIPTATVSGLTTFIGSNPTTGNYLTGTGWQTWNLFPLLTGAMVADGTLSIAIKETGGNSYYHSFDSSEATNTANHPYLSVTTAAPVPIPAAVWLLGSGLIGLIGIRRFKK